MKNENSKYQELLRSLADKYELGSENVKTITRNQLKFLSEIVGCQLPLSEYQSTPLHENHRVELPLLNPHIFLNPNYFLFEQWGDVRSFLSGMNYSRKGEIVSTHSGYVYE